MSDEKFQFAGSVDVSYIKQQEEEKQQKEDGKNTTWKPLPGTNTIRIFPYRHGKTPFTEVYMHYLGGKNGTILCPKSTFGENDCPICDFVKSLYSTGLEEDKIKASKFKAKPRIFIPVIYREEIAKGFEPKVRFWEVSKTVYDSIIKYCLNEDYGDIADPNEGNDLIVTFTEKNAQYQFGKTEILPRAKKTKVLEDMSLAKKLYEECPDVFSLAKLKKPTTDEIIARLEEFKNSVEEGTVTSDKDVESSINSEKNDLQDQIEKMLDQ